MFPLIPSSNLELVNVYRQCIPKTDRKTLSQSILRFVCVIKPSQIPLSFLVINISYFSEIREYAKYPISDFVKIS